MRIGATRGSGRCGLARMERAGKLWGGGGPPGGRGEFTICLVAPPAWVHCSLDSRCSLPVKAWLRSVAVWACGLELLI